MKLGLFGTLQGGKIREKHYQYHCEASYPRKSVHFWPFDKLGLNWVCLALKLALIGFVFGFIGFELGLFFGLSQRDKIL